MKYSTAESVNADVNASVTYKTDLEQYGRLEYYEPAGKYGDCEDYALPKRQRLVDAGEPIADMLLATCYLPDGQGHMVLLVKTDQDWYRDWETDRKSTRLNSSHSAKSRMPSSA